MSARDILNQIEKGTRFIVAGHVDPDGDTITSVLLLGRLLRYAKKDHVLYLGNSIPSKFRFLKDIDEITGTLPDWKPDTVITVDTPEPKMLGFKPSGARLINIDHHPSNTEYGDLNWLDTTRSAACLMVFELLREARIPVAKEEGVMVFTGVFTETGGFSYPNISFEAFKVCAEVLKLGVDASEIALRLTARDEHNLTLLVAVLNTLRIEDGLATIELTDKMLADAGVDPKDQDSDSFIRYPVSIPGVKIAVFFREEEKNGMVRLSFRSIRGVDVNKLASHFGGGGHQNAAGARVKGSYREVKRRVIEETKRYLSCAEA